VTDKDKQTNRLVRASGQEDREGFVDRDILGKLFAGCLTADGKLKREAKELESATQLHVGVHLGGHGVVPVVCVPACVCVRVRACEWGQMLARVGRGQGTNVMLQ
jgi:hypothetical protein